MPKRSDQRRRRNKTEPADRAQAFGGEPPDPDPDWHPIALRWFESLKESGQSRFYEASDWATAFVVAESMSRELNPQGIIYQGEVMSYHLMAVKASALSAWLSAMSSLLVTEGDRRRIRLELEAAPEVDPAEEAAVADLGSYRKNRSS